MEEIKKFDTWLNEQRSDIPWATDATYAILEGKISEIDILAQEASSFEAFVESFKKYAEENSISMEVDEETEKWLKTLYDQAKEHKDI